MQQFILWKLFCLLLQTSCTHTEFDQSIDQDRMDAFYKEFAYRNLQLLKVELSFCKNFKPIFLFMYYDYKKMIDPINASYIPFAEIDKTNLTHTNLIPDTTKLFFFDERNGHQMVLNASYYVSLCNDDFARLRNFLCNITSNKLIELHQIELHNSILYFPAFSMSHYLLSEKKPQMGFVTEITRFTILKKFFILENEPGYLSIQPVVDFCTIYIPWLPLFIWILEDVEMHKYYKSFTYGDDFANLLDVMNRVNLCFFQVFTAKGKAYQDALEIQILMSKFGESLLPFDYIFYTFWCNLYRECIEIVEYNVPGKENTLLFCIKLSILLSFTHLKINGIDIKNIAITKTRALLAKIGPNSQNTTMKEDGPIYSCNSAYNTIHTHPTPTNHELENDTKGLDTSSYVNHYERMRYTENLEVLKTLFRHFFLSYYKKNQLYLQACETFIFSGFVDELQ